MESLEDYDTLSTKLKDLEREVIDIHERYLTVAESIKEMQKYMVRIAQHQAIIADQIAHWPYIMINKKDGNLVKKQNNKE